MTTWFGSIVKSGDKIWATTKKKQY
jgi:hypothetical protein